MHLTPQIYIVQLSTLSLIDILTMRDVLDIRHSGMPVKYCNLEDFNVSPTMPDTKFSIFHN